MVFRLVGWSLSNWLNWTFHSFILSRSVYLVSVVYRALETDKRRQYNLCLLAPDLVQGTHLAPSAGSDDRSRQASWRKWCLNCFLTNWWELLRLGLRMRGGIKEKNVLGGA